MTCQDCQGRGRVYVRDKRTGEPFRMLCAACKGTGEVSDSKAGPLFGGAKKRVTGK